LEFGALALKPGTDKARFYKLEGAGGAEFRLPLLLAVFALYPHRGA